MSAAAVRDDQPGAAADGTGRAALEVKDLRVRFGGVTAVDGVSFSVAPGAILGFIGPNGAGKTTLFDAISGMVRAEGRVVLAGTDISGASPERRARARLGRSFQDARLFPSLTVAETLAVAFERHIRASDVVSTALRAPWVARTERRVRGRVEDLIGLMGLGAFRDKFVSELSTGSRRVVDLAAALAHDPAVLLLDEPSSGIAQREAEALAPLLVRIRDQTGATLLVIEHDMPLITSVSDEILALETGRVLTRGRPEEVLADPRVVASYLGTDAGAVARSGRAAGTVESGTGEDGAGAGSASGDSGTGRASRPSRQRGRTGEKATPGQADAKPTAPKKSAAVKRATAAGARKPPARAPSAPRTAAKKAAATTARPRGVTGTRSGGTGTGAAKRVPKPSASSKKAAKGAPSAARKEPRA